MKTTTSHDYARSLGWTTSNGYTWTLPGTRYSIEMDGNGFMELLCDGDWMASGSLTEMVNTAREVQATITHWRSQFALPEAH